MHHTCVYFQQSTGAITNADLPAVTDGWATVQNGHFIFQEDLDLWMSAYFGNTAVRGVLNAPHWRFVAQPAIQPVIQTWDGPEALISPLFGPRHIIVPRIDEIQALVTSSATGTAGDMVGMWLGKRPMNLNIPAGDVYPVPFTYNYTSANQPGQWSSPLNITFTQSLPAGRYSVIGADVVDANINLLRFRFQEYVMLPGVWVRNTEIGLARDVFRYGRLGEWGQFENTAQPTIQVFGTATGGTGTQQGVLDLVKIR